MASLENLGLATPYIFMFYSSTFTVPCFFKIFKSLYGIYVGVMDKEFFPHMANTLYFSIKLPTNPVSRFGSHCCNLTLNNTLV